MVRKHIVLKVLSLSLIFILGQTVSFSQIQDVPIDVFSTADLDKKGVFNFNMPVLYDYSSGSNRFAGEATSNFSGLDFDVRGGANISDGISIRGSGTINRTRIEGVVSELGVINTNMIGRIQVLKSLDVGSQKLFVGASAGVGCSKFTEEQSGDGEDFEFLENSFFWSIDAEAPILLRKSHVALVPYVSYFNEITKPDEGDDELTCSGGRIGARLDSYGNCGQFDPLHKNVGPGYSTGRYNKGTIALYGSNSIEMDFGSTKQTFFSGSEEFEFKGSKTDIDVNAAGGYYFANGIAGLFGVNYWHFGESENDTDFKQSNSDVSVNIGVQYHLPMDNFQNIYAKVKGGIGSQGSTFTDFEGVEQSNSEGNSQLAFAIGAYHNILPNVALNPIAEISCLNWSDSEYALLRCFFGIGMTTFL